METNLESLASDPSTPGAELQRLAGEYPNLRPLIAMNPATYPALLDWLAELADPAVNLALEQRRAALATDAAPTLAPQRVSVMSASPRPARPVASPTPQAWAPVSGPAPLQPQQQPQGPERKTGMVIAWVAALVLLIGAAGLLTFVLLNRDGGSTTADDGQDESVGTQESEELEETALDPKEDSSDIEESKEQEELPIRYPAPSSAITASKIVAPSGNIICRLGEEGVSCTILQYTFSDPTLSACAGSPVTLTTTDNFAEVDCTSPQVGETGGTSLSYGDYATFGNGACLSDFSGFSCWNIRTGSSFAVAREGFVTGNKGSIPPGQFWWN